MTRALDLYRAERRHLAQIELEAGGYEAGNIQNN